jgi:hypothetical protein|eukprot:Stramenopile-MAST_4_protein_4145
MATTAHSLPLKIQIVSDLHLESRQGLPTIKRAAPVLALLGDIGYASCGIEGDKLKQFLHAQTEMFDEVILLAGNHEYYGTSHEEGVAFIRALCEEVPRKNLHFLNRDEIELQGVRILGCTLWSRIPNRFRREAWSMMRDFEKIHDLILENELDHADDRAVMHAVNHGCNKYYEWYLRDVEWLKLAIEKARIDTANNLCNGIVILTHHAPLATPEAVCSLSMEMRGHVYGCEGTNNLYTSLVEVNDACVKAWAYGHTHKCFSMRCERSGLLLLSNPAGHHDGEVEGKFCPCCVIVVDEASAKKECACE